MKNKLLELFGWYGTIAIVVAYSLSSFSIIETSNIWYQILNATGALGIVAVSYYKKAYQPMVLNIIWTIIGVIALANILF